MFRSTHRGHRAASALLSACALALAPACRTPQSPPDSYATDALGSATLRSGVERPEEADRLASSEADVVLGTLDELLELARRANPTLRAARERVAASRHRVVLRDTLPDPVLTGAYYLEEVQTRVGPQEWAIGIQQRFPAPGSLGAAGRAAESRASVEADRLSEVALAVELEVKVAWFELYYLERSIETVEDNRDLLRSLEAVIRRDYAAGTVPYTDLIRAQVELGRLENRLAGLEDRRRPALARLNAALHRPPTAGVEPPKQLPERGTLPPLDGLVRRMESTSPELARWRHAREAAEHELEGARASGRPGFTLGLQYVETGDALAPGVVGSGDDPLIASLSIDLPVRRDRVRAAQREARATGRAAAHELEASYDRLVAALESEHFAARDAVRQIALFEETLVPRARQAFEATETAFRAGQTSFQGLVDAERVLLEFHLSLERAVTDRAIARARIEALVGGALDAAPPLSDPTSAEDPR